VTSLSIQADRPQRIQPPKQFVLGQNKSVKQLVILVGLVCVAAYIVW